MLQIQPYFSYPQIKILILIFLKKCPHVHHMQLFPALSWLYEILHIWKSSCTSSAKLWANLYSMNSQRNFTKDSGYITDNTISLCHSVFYSHFYVSNLCSWSPRYFSLSFVFWCKLQSRVLYWNKTIYGAQIQTLNSDFFNFLNYNISKTFVYISFMHQPSSWTLTISTSADGGPRSQVCAH